jgi:WD40 repeat protein
MPVQFPCPTCLSTLRLADSGLVGKTVICPECGATFTVPAPGPEPEVPLATAVPPSPVAAAIPVARPVEDVGRPAARRDPARNRGRPEHANSGNSALIWILAVAGGVLLLGGGCVVGIVLWVNRAATGAADDRDNMAQGAPWPDQWERGKVYSVPADGLTLTSRLTPTDDATGVRGIHNKVFQVQLDAGVVYSIRMIARVPLNPVARVGMDPVLRLDNAAGEQLAWNDNEAPGSLNARIVFPCQEDGVYRVVASHFSPSQGDFTLAITRAGERKPDPWQRDKIYEVPGGAGLVLDTRLTVNDERDPNRQGNYYRKVLLVRMDAGSRYTVQMSALPGQFKVDPALILEDPAGKLLARHDGNGGAGARLEFPCYSDGVYRVIATNFAVNGVGPFRLLLTRKAGPPDQWQRDKIYEVPSGANLTLASRLVGSDERDRGLPKAHRKVFQVRMTAGDRYTLRMKAADPARVDPVLRLLDATGKELAFNDDEAPGVVDARVDFRCPRDGVYQVVTTNRLPDSTGAFTLLITRKGAVANVLARFNISVPKTIRTVALAPDAALLAFAAGTDANRSVHFFDLAAKKTAPKRPTKGAFIGSNLAFAHDGKTAAFGDDRGAVTVWDCAAVKAKSYPGPKDTITAVHYLADNRLISASLDKTIRLWTTNPTGAEVVTLNVADAVRQLGVSADGRLAVALYQNSPRPELWDLQFRKAHEKQLPPDTAAHVVALSPDGKVLATGDAAGQIQLWDVASATRVKTLTGHQGLITGLCFSADGMTLASAGHDRTARVWDVPAGKPRAVFLGHQREVVCVALSANGRVLATGGNDQSIKVWDVPPAE